MIEFRGETTVVVPERKFGALPNSWRPSRPSAFHSFQISPSVDRFPLEPRFEVNYHLLSMEGKTRLRLKVRLAGKRAGDCVGDSGVAHRELARTRKF